MKRDMLMSTVHKELYFNGRWNAPKSSRYQDIHSPGDGSLLGTVAMAGVDDVDDIVESAHAGFEVWKKVPPAERAKVLKEAASRLRQHVKELAMLDAADCGNPVKEMEGDIFAAAAIFDFFAGLVTEMKGASIPMGTHAVNFSVREPLGVVARIVAFNHPLLFAAGKMAAPLAAGNAVIIKSPEQAPLSALKLAEIIGDLFPAGVISIVSGGADVGAALIKHKKVAMVALVGGVETGKAVMRQAAEELKPVLLELGGKNALLAFADVDPKKAAKAIVDGMNFTWCGQSCGSTSRAFVHADIYDAVLEEIQQLCQKFQPGIPIDYGTTMGAIISQRQHEKILSYIASAKAEGARLLYGGKVPDAPELQNGFFIEPTVFCDVTTDMRIAKDEIFGPVLSVIRWSDEDAVIRDINSTDFGLTSAIWTNDLQKAHLAAQKIQAGFVWINEVGKHFLGAPFGGVKKSGIGREECLSELLAFTSEKNIHINLQRVSQD